MLDESIICSKHCGSKCCKSTLPALTTDDFNLISKIVKGTQWFHFIEPSDKKIRVISKKNSSNDCFFLTENKMCRIYENRPLDCELFPLFIKIKKLDNSEYNIKWLVWFCPLTEVKGIELLRKEARTKIKNLLTNNPNLIFEYQDAMYVSMGYKKKHALDEECLKIQRSEI